MNSKDWERFENAFCKLGKEESKEMSPEAALALAAMAENFMNGGPGSSALPIALPALGPRAKSMVTYPDDYAECLSFWTLDETTAPPIVKITPAGVDYVKRHKTVFDCLRVP